MDPTIATLICGCGIVGCLIVDSQRKLNVSAALWVPTIWLAILASRPASSWLSPSLDLNVSAVVEEGSPLDRNIALLLIVISTFILLKRKLDWIRLVNDNKWLVVLFLYCGISILWSDFPAVALKRWIRALGAIIVILVVVSEGDPVAAIGTVVRRCAYILIPVSILFIKYYRDLGVLYDFWTGELNVVGVGVNKNGLGRLCLVAGLFCLWDIITTLHDKKARRNKTNLILSMCIGFLTIWLLIQAQSATSLAAFLIGSAVIVSLGLPGLRNSVRYLGTIVTFTVCLFVVIGLSTDLLETAVGSLGRNMTFTSRTEVWADLWSMHTNPFVGVGYDSFWLGERLNRFIEEYKVNEAHNGYLEVYLELGVVGLFLLIGLLLSVFRRAKYSLSRPGSFDYGRLQLAFLTIFLLYNVTEAAYKATTLMFFVFLLIGVEFPRRKSAVPIVRDPGYYKAGSMVGPRER